jgi:hypothetical protein
MQETTLIEQGQPVPVILGSVPAPAPTMTLCSYGTKLTREELARVATPVGTAAHKPIPHIAVVEKLIEALGFRQIGVVREEYAVSSDGMRMFGVMDLSSGFDGCRFHADCPIMPTPSGRCRWSTSPGHYSASYRSRMR